MNFMNRVIVACCILLCTSVWKISAQDYPFRRADLPVEERVEDLVRRMTLEEKIDLLAGYQDFYLHPCERLGIPAFKLADGPLGLASWGLFGKATAFPSALSLAGRRLLRTGMACPGHSLPFGAGSEHLQSFKGGPEL